MKIGYYGHTQTMVIMFTHDGIYNDGAVASGIRFLENAVRSSFAAGETKGFSNSTPIDCDKYRRTYFEAEFFETEDGRPYYAFNRHLGRREGVTPHNIYSNIPETKGEPLDILYIVDNGYGGLEIPTDCRNYFWASEVTLPPREIFSQIADRTFLMLDADVLRAVGAMISRQISWERTASELIRELHNNPTISYLLDTKYLFVTFDCDGAVFLMKKNGEVDASIMLTHGHSEGTVESSMQGFNMATFTVMSSYLGQHFPTLLSQNMPEGEISDLFMTVFEIETQSGVGSTSAIHVGAQLRTILELGESFYKAGFAVSDNKSNMNVEIDIVSKEWPAFPIPASINGIVPEDWIITNGVGDKNMYDVAFEYVQKGADVIAGLPQLSFGALTTIDRWEIESYQNIRNLILNYANSNSTRPLSIAVFGSPGSGKSFGVTEIAENILPGKVAKLEFNVSQFISLDDLASAFQRVRDIIFEGKLPLVFFDEFDSDKDGAALGWVKSFLMPMQDGRFRDGTGEHPLGKCILVFAGGTAATFEEFANPTDPAHFKNIKGPDFLSRLRGTISILGPNPKDSSDKNYILRRALLLRSLILRKLGGITLSPSIIRAMLLVPTYHHGARSMEAILDMSRPEGKTLEPAALPFNTQLALHLDADAFIKLVSEKI